MHPSLIPHERPPANRAQAWFRAVLWLMPAVFGVASKIGLGWLEDKLGHDRFWAIVWWMINPAFVIATGWFNALLSTGNPTVKNRISNRVVIFFLAQLLLIPLLWLVTFFVAIKCGLTVIE